MGLVPGKNFSYSDHEAVAASFVVKESALEKAGMKKQPALSSAIFVFSNWHV